MEDLEPYKALPASTLVRLRAPVWKHLSTVVRHWCCVSPELAALRPKAFDAVGRYVKGADLADLSDEDKIAIRDHAPFLGLLRTFAHSVLLADADNKVRALMDRSLHVARLSTWLDNTEDGDTHSMVVDLSPDEMAELNDPATFFQRLCRVLLLSFRSHSVRTQASKLTCLNPKPCICLIR